METKIIGIMLEVTLILEANHWEILKIWSMEYPLLTNVDGKNRRDNFRSQ